MVDPEGQEEQSESGAENWRRQLENERNQYRDQLAEAQRELALYRSGLSDLNEDQRAALLAVVGEPNEEALKEKAKALGFVKEAAQPQPQPESQVQGGRGQEFVQAQAAQAFQRLDNATSSSSVPQQPGNLVEQLREAQGDQAKVMEILANSGMLLQK